MNQVQFWQTRQMRREKKNQKYKYDQENNCNQRQNDDIKILIYT